MITVTSAAQAKLGDILDGQELGPQVIRVSVVRGPHGCAHGWNLSLDKAAGPDDVVYEVGRLQLAVERALTGELSGATIDYLENGSVVGFTIDAPTRTHTGRHAGGCAHH